MRIESNQSAAALRLVQPAAPSPAADTLTPVHTASDAPRSRDSDAISFEALYVNTLPRIPLSDAQRRLQHLRENLVAATVPGPIRFTVAGSERSTNPYSLSFVRLVADPSEANIAATEQSQA